MLPFVFKMSPVEAFAFLLGMHSVAATTGDITSILFGVPGEGLSAATVVDGHPMAKRGEAARALGAALMSSLVGVIGAARSPCRSRSCARSSSPSARPSSSWSR